MDFDMDMNHSQESNYVKEEQFVIPETEVRSLQTSQASSVKSNTKFLPKFEKIEKKSATVVSAPESAGCTGYNHNYVVGNLFKVEFQSPILNHPPSHHKNQPPSHRIS